MSTSNFKILYSSKSCQKSRRLFMDHIEMAIKMPKIDTKFPIIFVLFGGFCYYLKAFL